MILNSNDYLEHVFEYKEKYPTVLSTSDYNGIIGGALRYKAWAYLMLAKIYGEAVYLDDPLATYQDLSQYPVLKFDGIIDKCIDLIETGMNGVNGKGDIRGLILYIRVKATLPNHWNGTVFVPPRVFVGRIVFV